MASKYMMFPADKSFKVRNVQDVINAYRNGLISTFGFFTEIKNTDPLPEGWHLYEIMNPQGEMRMMKLDEEPEPVNVQ